jgi:hypothetical protein
MTKKVTLQGGPMAGKEWWVTPGTKSLAIPCTAEGVPIIRGDPQPKVRGGWLVYDADSEGNYVFYRQTR